MISIVVPVFNTMDKLPKCIESILKQTYDDIELILVDDGSTDDSYSVCMQYAEKDRRVKVFRQDNQGVSVARNKGIELASGKYIGFIDSDDYIDPDMFEELVKFIEEGYDLAACGYVAETVSGVIQYETKGDILALNSREDIFRRMFQGDGFGPNVCNKLLKRDIIEKQNIRFPEGLKIGEDMVMLCLYVYHCTKAVYYPNAMYHYVTLEDSAYHKRFTRGEFDMSFYEEIKAHKIVYNKLQEDCVREVFVIKMYYVYLRALKFLCMANIPDKELYHELLKFLRRNLLNYVFSNVTIKQKLHALIMTVNPQLWLMIFSKREVYNGQ